MNMFKDNKTSFTLIRDLESQNKTKHIDVIHHHIRRLVEKKEPWVEWILCTKIPVNGLTKALSTKLFKKHQDE